METGLALSLYRGLSEYLVTQPAFFLLHLLSTLALASGCLAVIAAAGATLLERRFEPRLATALATGALAAVVLLGTARNYGKGFERLINVRSCYV